LAGEIRKSLGIDTDLIRGSGGVFEIKLGNDLVFSKKKEGRFPETEEILDSLRSKS
jgi:selenoprotein W-related protein